MTHRRQPYPPRLQRGAAILTAMLLVTLVASLSAAALWQQWRGIEVETAERARTQSAWILQGALDWARLILREDACTGATDHLAEPWAVALQEARLSTFLATGNESGGTPDALQDAFLSGRITDLQGRLNVLNLVQDGRTHAPTLRAFARLFEALHLPAAELLALTRNLRLALDPQAPVAAGAPPVPLLPRDAAELGWLGLSPASVALLQPFVAILPERTPVNLNTAPALVLHACIAGLGLSDAQRLVSTRAQTPFRSLADVAQALGNSTAPALSESQHSVNSRYFEVRTQLRLDPLVVQERTMLQRDGLDVKVVWRQRGAQSPLPSLQ